MKQVYGYKFQSEYKKLHKLRTVNYTIKFYILHFIHYLYMLINSISGQLAKLQNWKADIGTDNWG
jgi:hypothetical protein